MKLRLPILALVLTVLLGGCLTADKLNNVHVGMTKGDVIALLGNPNSTSAQANIEYLTYYLEAETGDGRDQPYLVRLVDGKVESFGRFAQLSDIYNRPVAGSPPPAPGSPAAYALMPAGGTDLAGQLERLKTLKDQGVLTEQEFQLAKQKLLLGQ
jgi:hypothetical protein